MRPQRLPYDLRRVPPVTGPASRESEQHHFSAWQDLRAMRHLVGLDAHYYFWFAADFEHAEDAFATLSEHDPTFIPSQAVRILCRGDRHGRLSARDRELFEGSV